MPVAWQIGRSASRAACGKVRSHDQIAPLSFRYDQVRRFVPGNVVRSIGIVRQRKFVCGVGVVGTRAQRERKRQSDNQNKREKFFHNLYYTIYIFFGQGRTPPFADVNIAVVFILRGYVKIKKARRNALPRYVRRFYSPAIPATMPRTLPCITIFPKRTVLISLASSRRLSALLGLMISTASAIAS